MEYELYHYGKRGMRWGIRRYQYKDGSLTPAGKKRYQSEMDALKKEEAVLKNRQATKRKLDRLDAKRKAIEDQKKALDGDEVATKKPKKTDVEPTPTKKAGKKSISEMTDEELATAINRARMEDAYRQLRPEPVKQPLMKKLVDEVVVPAAINSGKQLVQNVMNNAVANLTKGKIDPDSVQALTAVRDKLKLKAEIANYKNHPDHGINWDNMLKKQTYNQNEETAKAKRDAEAADAKAKRDADKAATKAEKDAAKAAKKDAKKAAEEERKREMDNYQKNRDDYLKSIDIDNNGPDPVEPYRSKGDRTREFVNPSETTRALAIRNEPVTSLSTTMVERGKSSVNPSETTTALAIRNEPVTSLSTAVVSRGRETAFQMLGDGGRFELLDTDGTSLLRYSGMKDGLNGTF